MLLLLLLAELLSRPIDKLSPPDSSDPFGESGISLSRDVKSFSMMLAFTIGVEREEARQVFESV